jgi:hypothetical protein
MERIKRREEEKSECGIDRKNSVGLTGIGRVSVGLKSECGIVRKKDKKEASVKNTYLTPPLAASAFEGPRFRRQLAQKAGFLAVERVTAAAAAAAADAASEVYVGATACVVDACKEQAQHAISVHK